MGTSLLWISLALAFSPAIAALLQNLVNDPPDRYTLLAPACLLLALWAGPREPVRPRRSGLLLLAAGLALEVVGAAAGTRTLMWLGLPMGILGLGVWLGRPRPALAIVAFGAVPVPDSLMGLLSPDLETALARAAAAIYGSLGATLETVGPRLQIGGAKIDLVAAHGGAPLAVVLAELAWLDSLLHRRPAWQGLRRALAAAVLAVPVAGAIVTLAALALALGAPEAGRALLDNGGAVLGALGLAALAARRRLGHAAHSAPERSRRSGRGGSSDS